MRITTCSDGGITIAWDTSDSNEAKEIVYYLIQIARLLVTLSQRTIKEVL